MTTSALEHAISPQLPVDTKRAALRRERRQPELLPEPRPITPGLVGRALTLAHRIQPGHKTVLRDYLNRIGQDIKASTDIPFARLRTVHFMRWVILEDEADDGGTLVFESNFDGAVEEHLDELLLEAPGGMHEIYRHCVDYPLQSETLTGSNFESVRSFLKAMSVDYGAFHVGSRGKSSERIRLEGEVRDVVERHLNQAQREPNWSSLSLEQIYDGICAAVEREGLLARLKQDQPAKPQIRTLKWVLGLGKHVLPVLPVFVPLLLVLLIKEAFDKPAKYGAPPEWVRKLAEREDFQVQNQLTHVVSVKPGLFRRWLLRKVLSAIDLLARERYNQGALGGITTIHFARWVFLDEGRTLLFFSNYDGSWESYLGDFVDKAHAGLTSVWSNTEGFPRTLALLYRGATDEEAFKAWTRAHQIPTPLWYSAYPQLTVRNIQKNTLLCDGLVNKPASTDALRDWLDSV